MMSAEALFLLKPRFVEAEPGFIPRPANPGDAGADIKLYVELGQEQPISTDLMCQVYKEDTGLVIDGKLVPQVDYPLVQNQTTRRTAILKPGERKLFHAGFKIGLNNVPAIRPLLPVYYIVSRSGLSTKWGVKVTNRPGVVDSTYRGWVRVSLENTGDHTHVFTHGARIAQGILDLVVDQSYWSTDELKVESLDETVRGTGGFGSTGV